MRREESRYPDDWFRVGRKELRRAERLLEVDDPEGAAFNLQGCVPNRVEIGSCGLPV